MLITTDVRNILQTLNGNNFWNHTLNQIDISKSIKAPGTATNNRKNNYMTED